MDTDIALFLAQDGIVNAAIYSLIGLAIVQIFLVTRILYVPQGEFVSFSALTFAAISAGKVPVTVWLAAAGLCVSAAMTVLRHGLGRPRLVMRQAGAIAYAAGLVLLSLWWIPAAPPQIFAALLTLAIIVPLGPVIYTVAFEGIAERSSLTLLIAAVAVHFALVGAGLLAFGPEGVRAAPISDLSISLGPLIVPSQSLLVLAGTAAIMGLLFAFFGSTITGKALRATAISRRGAKIVGISPQAAGRTSLLLAALVGGISGILISPITTIYYDSGFLVGLKGFVAAIIAGLVSYPGAVAGALAVGLIESFSSFWASAFKEVIVFALIIPILLWRSFKGAHSDLH